MLCLPMGIAYCEPLNQAMQTTQKDIVQNIAHLFGEAKPFDAKRSADDLRTSCRQWIEPAAPDPASHEWYRAATTLHAIKYRTIEQHQQMLILYEAAARRGHYLAMKNLTIVYSEGALVRGGRFKPEPEKARAWINAGLEREWPGALEWVATAMLEGSAGFSRDSKLGWAYMQQAADLGVALAQYQLGLNYGDRLKQLEQESALMDCAAVQNQSAALYNRAIYYEIHNNPLKVLEMYQRALMAGGPKGADAANALWGAFVKDSYDQQLLQTAPDEARKNAYRELDRALAGGSGKDGNTFLRFPRLNEVLPLPPAKMPPWKGIYSAMSPDDAAYYQNPPPAEFYIEEVRRAGYMVPDGYLSQPVPER
ncbi:DUF6396 domain-containing protein [Saezia sanguinis]|uniref:DUF6396 domain-containing protein n=1 Tax=Saezia sanguinis TaxID=1965230 RepID=UPI003052AAA4